MGWGRGILSLAEEGSEFLFITLLIFKIGEGYCPVILFSLLLLFIFIIFYFMCVGVLPALRLHSTGMQYLWRPESLLKLEPQT